MTTNFLFSAEGHVITANSTNASVGDPFSMLVSWSAQIPDENPGDQIGYFYGMTGEFTLGSVHSEGVFESISAFLFGESSFSLLSVGGSTPGAPNHQVILNGYDEGLTLLGDPNNPSIFLPSIAAEFQNASVCQVDFYNMGSGSVDAVIGIDNIQFQIMAVPEPSTAALVGLALLAACCCRKRLIRS